MEDGIIKNTILPCGYRAGNDFQRQLGWEFPTTAGARTHLTDIDAAFSTIAYQHC
jgi:hypothetical protein